jgi:hypothetical protein
VPEAGRSPDAGRHRLRREVPRHPARRPCRRSIRERSSVTVIGDREHLPSDRLAQAPAPAKASNVPLSRKLFVRAPSDDHGFPTIRRDADRARRRQGRLRRRPSSRPRPEPPRDPKARPPAFRWSADMALTGDQTRLTAQLQTATADSLDFWRSGRRSTWRPRPLSRARPPSRSGTARGFAEMGRWSDGWPVRRLGAETPKIDAPTPREAAPGPRLRPPEPRRRL